MVSLSKNEFNFKFCAGQAASVTGVHDTDVVRFGFDVRWQFDLFVYGAEASAVFVLVAKEQAVFTVDHGCGP
jgi:hypothetical protein